MIQLQNIEDPNRMSGRTTRMLDAVAQLVQRIEDGLVKGRVIVLCSTHDHAQIIRKKFHAMGCYEQHVRFLGLNELRRTVGTIEGNDHIYWDHAAIDQQLWDDAHAAVKRAEDLRREQEELVNTSFELR